MGGGASISDHRNTFTRKRNVVIPVCGVEDWTVEGRSAGDVVGSRHYEATSTLKEHGAGVEIPLICDDVVEMKGPRGS